MINKPTTLLLTLVLFSATASAQSLTAFREHLAKPELAGTSYQTVAVTSTEHGDAVAAISKATSENYRLRFKGYKVCIFFDNGQNARSGAKAAYALFTSSFPETKADMVYNTPYFTVTVGNCVTSEEAIILMGRVKELFPKAFIKNEELSVSDLVK